MLCSSCHCRKAIFVPILTNCWITTKTIEQLTLEPGFKFATLVSEDRIQASGKILSLIASIFIQFAADQKHLVTSYPLWLLWRSVRMLHIKLVILGQTVLSYATRCVFDRLMSELPLTDGNRQKCHPTSVLTWNSVNIVIQSTTKKWSKLTFRSAYGLLTLLFTTKVFVD